METCTCGHRAMVHHYHLLTGYNSGKCLIRDCECTIYEGAR